VDLELDQRRLHGTLELIGRSAEDERVHCREAVTPGARRREARQGAERDRDDGEDRRAVRSTWREQRRGALPSTSGSASLPVRSSSRSELMPWARDGRRGPAELFQVPCKSRDGMRSACVPSSLMERNGLT